MIRALLIAALLIAPPAMAGKRNTIRFQLDEPATTPADPGCIPYHVQSGVIADASCNEWTDTGIQKRVYPLNKAKGYRFVNMLCGKARGTIQAGENVSISAATFVNGTWTHDSTYTMVWDGDVAGTNAPGDIQKVAVFKRMPIAAQGLGVRFHTLASGTTTDWDFICALTYEDLP
jgi:hypothetical protein